jgi:hypothetical protein
VDFVFIKDLIDDVEDKMFKDVMKHCSFSFGEGARG